MVQILAYRSKVAFQFSKIDEHTRRIEFFSFGIRPHQVIMTMEPLALSMIFGQIMSSGKICFNPYGVHGTLQPDCSRTVCIAQERAGRYHHGMKQRLRDILPPTMAIAIHGDLDVPVEGLSYDSREIRPGYVFFALPGLHAHGNQFINAAVRSGAVAIIHEQPLAMEFPGTTLIQVPDARAAMSPVASAFHGEPSRKLAVVGVTGTEGKSTTVWLIYRLLDLAGKKAGFFSTVDRRIGPVVEHNPKHQTTPEATTVHDMLGKMAADNFEYAVVESSSHGLSPRTARLADVAFDVGVMTNVRHEHLEFHGTWEQYRDDKANLFRALDQFSHDKMIAGKKIAIPSFGVACLDDPSTAYFSQATSRPVYTYSVKDTSASLYSSDECVDGHGASFMIHEGSRTYPARIELPGAFNIENTLAAVLVVTRLTGIPLDTLVPLLPELEPVRGRMTRIDSGQSFEVLVDYAHTPSSFEAILPSIKARSKGKIICVFGSGGERDVQKRPAQGRIASKYCAIVILADEDPRGEDPMTLLEDIAAGCDGMVRGKTLFLIPDRKLAIRKAIAQAEPGDVVLLLGKSHELTIDYASGSMPWNEIDEARTALAEAGYSARD